MDFFTWKAEVDKILIGHIGLVQDDLPDWLARDAYDDGIKPIEGARQCLLNACEYMGFDEKLVDEL